MIRTYNDGDIIESRTADTKAADNIIGNLAQSISLARVVSTEVSARAWRITLGRVNRRDKAAYNNGVFPNEPLLKFPGYSYTAGFVFPPGSVPPRRSNPIWGFNTSPLAGTNVASSLFVQISFGMPGAEPNRLLANWPLQGGSVVVEGSYVEVFGGLRIISNESIDPNSFPVFQATITPIDGLASADAGELSLTQFSFLENESPTPIEAGLLTNGVTDPPGFVWEVGPTPAAIPIGAVFRTPTEYWTALIGSKTASLFQLAIFISEDGGAQFELRDNEIPDSSGNFVPSPGNVGIVYRSDGGAFTRTVNDLEDLINIQSGIALVSTPDPNGTFLLTDGWGTTLPPLSDGFGLAVGQLVSATGGGSVFVPDFARRVMVTLTNRNEQFINEDLRVPITGPIPCQLVWYDDFGVSIFSEFQGPVAAPNTGVEPTVWRPVPAGAVMLGIYGPPNEAPPDVIALIHWRIAP